VKDLRALIGNRCGACRWIEGNQLALQKENSMQLRTHHGPLWLTLAKRLGPGFRTLAATRGSPIADPSRPSEPVLASAASGLYEGWPMTQSECALKLILDGRVHARPAQDS